MDVGIGILWTVDLDDPVNSREVNTTGRDVGTEEHGVLFLDELEIYCCSLILVLLSVEL